MQKIYRSWFFVSQDEMILIICCIFCCLLRSGNSSSLPINACREPIWKPTVSTPFLSDCVCTKVQWFRADTFCDKTHIFAALGSGFHRKCVPQDNKVVRAKKASMTRSETTRWLKKEKKEREEGKAERTASVASSEWVTQLIKNKARIPAERQDWFSGWSSAECWAPLQPKVNASIYFWLFQSQVKNWKNNDIDTWIIYFFDWLNLKYPIIQEFNLSRRSCVLGARELMMTPFDLPTKQRSCSHHLIDEFVNTTNDLFLLSHLFPMRFTDRRRLLQLCFLESTWYYDIILLLPLLSTMHSLLLCYGDLFSSIRASVTSSPLV